MRVMGDLRFRETFCGEPCLHLLRVWVKGERYLGTRWSLHAELRRLRLFVGCNHHQQLGYNFIHIFRAETGGSRCQKNTSYLSIESKSNLLWSLTFVFVYPHVETVSMVQRTMGWCPVAMLNTHTNIHTHSSWETADGIIHSFHSFLFKKQVRLSSHPGWYIFTQGPKAKYVCESISNQE